jgi:hypothetical protein
VSAVIICFLAINLWVTIEDGSQLPLQHLPSLKEILAARIEDVPMMDITDVLLNVL